MIKYFCDNEDTDPPGVFSQFYKRKPPELVVGGLKMELQIKQGHKSQNVVYLDTLTFG